MTAVLEANRGQTLETIQERLELESQQIHAEDIELNRQLGQYGQQLLKERSTVLTHCNTGSLATAGYGTALGIVRAAVENGKALHVFANETRPFLQGARLTAWEMAKERIPCTLITDNMSGFFMQSERIDAVIVGADRIARNGDTANKIGTYTVAVLAKEHQVPFYVAAPLSTIDFETDTGSGIPIEKRDSREVTEINGKSIAPSGIKAENPAFDVTPHRLIAAIVTEEGIAREPYEESLLQLLQKARNA
jgi:methylthioribose-1-phosphate isomerase